MKIRNGSKQTISTNGRLWLLQMVSESDIERCANEDTGPQRGRLWDPTLVGEGNEAFLIRVWKPLLSKQYLLTVSLIYYIHAMFIFHNSCRWTVSFFVGVDAAPCRNSRVLQTSWRFSYLPIPTKPSSQNDLSTRKFIRSSREAVERNPQVSRAFTSRGFARLSQQISAFFS